MKFIDIILEQEFKRKESIKKTFHTYSCYFIVKFKKEVNRLEIIERVRGIKSVTIVDLRGDEKIDKINRNLIDYAYSSVEVKFITNRDPRKQVEYIRKAMVKSDTKRGIDNIVGIVGASARLETLKKLKK